MLRKVLQPLGRDGIGAECLLRRGRRSHLRRAHQRSQGFRRIRAGKGVRYEEDVEEEKRRRPEGNRLLHRHSPDHPQRVRRWNIQGSITEFDQESGISLTNV